MTDQRSIVSEPTDITIWDQQPDSLTVCPVCAEVFAVRPIQKSDQIAAVFGMSGDTMARMHFDQATRQQEREIYQHLDSHGTVDWLRALRRHMALTASLVVKVQELQAALDAAGSN